MFCLVFIEQILNKNPHFIFSILPLAETRLIFFYFFPCKDELFRSLTGADAASKEDVRVCRQMHSTALKAIPGQLQDVLDTWSSG